MKRLTQHTDNEGAGIGPLPQVLPENAVGASDTFRPLKVDRSDPAQQALATRIGWPEVERIARSSQLPGDLQRGPFDGPKRKKNTPVFLTKKPDKNRGPIIEKA